MRMKRILADELMVGEDTCHDFYGTREQNNNY